MFGHGIRGVVLGVVLLAVAGAANAGLIASYTASSISGQLAPPDYALRLDEFWGPNSDRATFDFVNVCLEVYDDGTARLFGVIEVVEVNQQAPGQYASTWDLDVALVQTGTDANNDWSYWSIDGDAGTELVNQDDANDYAELISYGPDFQLGTGANGKNPNFGAAGWLNYVHYDNGDVYGNLDTHYYASDFLMDLTPKPDRPVVPEPATMALVTVGLSAAGFARRRRKA